jgi:hypothetical protein
MRASNPSWYRVSRSFRDLKLQRALRLLLNVHGPRSYPIAVCDITHSNPHQIASTQLAINRQIE